MDQLPIITTWIYENRAWIFDGLGVALLTALLGGLAWVWRRQREKRQKQPALATPQQGAKNVGLDFKDNTFQGDVTIEQVTVGDTHNYLPAAQDKATRTARRRAYLSHIYNEARRLSLEGIDRKAAGDEQDTAIPLDAIYTALWTLQTETKELLPLGKRKTDDIAIKGDRVQKQLSAVAQLDRHARLVLLGAPGSGKSTFVNFVALCLAGHGLNNPTVNLDLLTAPLPADSEGKSDEKDEPLPHQPWSHKGLIPVRVVLRHFAAAGLPAHGEKATADPLWRYICGELAAATLGDFADELKNELFKVGGLLLLDGLDEVSDADQQREQLKAVISAFAGTYGKCRILITSRPYAYQQENWQLAGFTDTTLAPFSDAQIRRFVEHWYSHVAPLRQYKMSDAQGRAEQLKKAIFASDRLHLLAEQPLLLTLMASLHAWHGSELPDKRERLYAEAVDLLLERWEKQRVERRRDGSQIMQPSLQEYLQVGREAILAVLDEIAYEVHAAQPKLSGVADIGRDKLIQKLFDINNNPNIKQAQLLLYLSQRAGLLLPEGNTLFRFPHRTFQEYLAARYLTSDKVDFPDKVAELARHTPDRWREVALLAAAKATGGAASLIWTLVDALCRFAPADPEFTLEDAWGAHLAGQALLESAKLENLSVRNQEKVDRVRQGLIYVMRSADFLPSERALAGRTLAGLGDPRFRNDAWFLPDDPMLGFIEIPAGTFKMGSDKRRDKAAEDNETPQHELDLPAFYIARYPVTVGQFRAFVEATGDQPRNAASLRDPDNHPVRWVTWYEATRYCQWLDKTLRTWDKTPAPLAAKLRQGWQILLPSEAEWEKAARGTDGRRYPWVGSKIDVNRANYAATGIGTTSAVGCFPGGATPEGVEELSGNVCEWTRSLYQAYPYPSDEKGRRARDRLKVEDRSLLALRGGAYYDNEKNMCAAFRYRDNPDNWYNVNGFRVVCVSAPGF